MVRLVRGHHNWIAVAYTQFLVCYRCSGRVVAGGLGLLTGRAWGEG